MVADFAVPRALLQGRGANTHKTKEFFHMETNTSPSTRRRGRTVPFTIGSNIGFVPVDSIRGWKDAHGTTRAGKTINSPRFANIGDSTIIQGETGPALSLPADQVEVLVVEMAKHFGYKVTS